MSIIQTKINKDSDRFISNYDHHKTLSDDLNNKIKKIREMGTNDKVEKHRSRGDRKSVV